MSHIELRDIDDDDLDAIFEVVRDDDVERTASDVPDDRSAFDEWMLRLRDSAEASAHVVTDDGGFAGVAWVDTVGGERTVAYAIARHAGGRGVGGEALRLLVSREADRPLYARLGGGDTASLDLLAPIGFSELDGRPGVHVLPPTLE